MSNNTNTISTNGWDTVYAIKYPDVNNAIKMQKSSPTSYSQTSKDPTFGAIICEGDFGDWEVVTGGDGKNINMCLPITNCSVSIPQLKMKKSFTGLNAIIQLNLCWLHQEIDHLKVDKNEETISVLRIEQDGKKFTGLMGQTAIALEKWLVNNISEFNHVFSSITLNKTNDVNNFQWLMPTDTLYAVADLGTAENSVFGVLCMTENRPSPKVHEISPFAIGDGATSSFLIAPERILENMIFPGMKLLFKNANDSDFKISNDGLTITNCNNLEFKNQELKNGDIISPKIDKNNFSLTMQDSEIKMSFDDLHFKYPIPVPLLKGKTWVPDMPGITVNLTHTTNASLKTTSSNGFKMDVLHSTSSVNVTTASWLNWTEIGAGLVLSIGGAIAGGVIGDALSAGTTAATSATETTVDGMVMTAEASAESASTNITSEVLAETAADLGNAASKTGKFAAFFARNWAKMLGAMTGAGLGAGIAASPKIIAAIANDKGGEEDINLDKFGTEALNPLKWPNQGPVKLVNGALNGSFQMNFIDKQ